MFALVNKHLELNAEIKKDSYSILFLEREGIKIKSNIEIKFIKLIIINKEYSVTNIASQN